MVTIRNLGGTNNEQILDCFNHSFSDYSIPLQLNLKQLESKLNVENINKEYSVGAFEGTRLVGLVLHGDRHVNGIRAAYNAGTGVRPTHRGQRLTQSMYDFVLPKLRTNGFKEVVLEVITTNVSAIRSYEAIGFHRFRNLVCFSGQAFSESVNDEVRIVTSKQVDLSLLKTFGEIQATWQNSFQTAMHLKAYAKWILAFHQQELCAYAVLNTTNNRLLQIAVKTDWRNKLVGSTVLNYISSNLSKSISIINVDGSYLPAIAFFKKRNMKETLTQNEMKLVF